MKLQNLTLATAMLLALTGCGSSGGGNSSAPKINPLFKMLKHKNK